MVTQITHPLFREAFFYWLKLGFINFGGPTGQIAIMHAELVEKRKWISEEHFLHALNYCMLLPGPEAMQLATYIGWLLHGTFGGIIAGAFFVLPSVLLLLLLSWVYVVFGNLPVIVGVFAGVKPVVIAIVAFATYRLAARALKDRLQIAFAIAAFVAIYFLQIPFPFIVLGAGLAGLLLPQNDALAAMPRVESRSRVPSTARNARLIAAFLMLWAIPLALLIAWHGARNVFVDEYLFFTLAAFVTVGGAYAVLAFIAQAAVVQFNWLSSAQMIDGLALAETTPGPLIIVLQFVGYLGATKFHQDLNPTLAGALGGLITTYVTFLPSFFFIFLGAPYIERLRGNAQLNRALSAITAAVVGVILNLAVILGSNVLFLKGQPDYFAGLIAMVALIGLWKWKWGIAGVVVGGGAVGLVRVFVGV